MNKAVTTATCIMAIAALGASAQASAQGFYIGASALQSRFDADDFDIDDVDEEDTGWKLFAGFRATPNFGIEAAYTRFGEAEAPAVEVGGPFEAQAEAFSLIGVGAIPLGPVELFAKVGAARIESRGNVGAVFFDENEIELAYGVGAQLNLGALGVRVEYEKFDTDTIGDLDVISAGLVFTFRAHE